MSTNTTRYNVDFKMKVVKAYQESGKTQPEICDEFNISRSSLCKWLKEYSQSGADGLVNKKPVPHNPARKTAKKIIREVVELKQQEEHKYSGLRAFADYLKRFKGIALSATTLSKIFKKEGLPSGAENYIEQRAKVNPKKHELLEKEITAELNQVERFERPNPGDLWQIDITQFYIKDDGKVYMVDMIDDHSRFIVGWGLFRDQKAENVIQVFQDAVNKYGKPKELLSDNGRQFTSWHGITDFEALLDKLEIKHIKARPHHPQTLGKLERWHGTLKKELIDVKFFHSMAEAKEEIAHYIDHYHYHRTHSSLDGLVPADRFYGVARQVKEELLQQNDTSAPNNRLYLLGKLLGKELRIQEHNGTVEVFWNRQRILSYDFLA